LGRGLHALVEHFDGRLEVIDWIDRWALDPLIEQAAAAAESDFEASMRVREDCARTDA